MNNTIVNLVLVFKGRDSFDRPVYECNGKLYVDVDPCCEDTPPDIYTKSSNEFDGEPDIPVHAEFDFIPHRYTWH